ncbi:MAG: oligosaccharide flippase family protein [Cruoricaptor ignavus]|nr:oligosaccharide flippase family protein [Cruoricaptor ignavus]
MGNRIWDKFIKGDFKKNALVLAGGTAVSQIINVIFYPILGRLFTPEEFGVFALLNTIVSILSVIATLKYEDAILIAKTKKEVVNIISLCLLLSVGILTVIFVTILCFSSFLANQLGVQDVAKWLFLCPINALALVVFNLYNEWCVKNKYFSYLSVNKVTSASTLSLGKLFFGMSKYFSGGGLILGDTIGRFATSIICVYRGWRLEKDFGSHFSFPMIKSSLKKYNDFPKFYLPDQLINKLGQALPIVLLGIFYTEKEVGFFSMTLAVLSLPVSVISIALKDVFRQKANQDFMEYGNCRPIFRKLFIRLFLLAFVGCLVLFFFMPSLFSLFLGEQWYMAGVYSQILLPMIAFSFVSMSLSGVLVIAKKLKQSMYWQILYLLITLLSLYIGYWYFKDIIFTLIIFSIGRSLAYAVYIAMSYKYAKK